MATLESQYWKFLEENPGSALTFEQWKVEFSKQLGESLMRYKDKEIEKLENQLEEIEMVRYRMEAEGFHYCFESYSSFEKVEDEKFHELRKQYLKSSKELEEYVFSKIDSIQYEIGKYYDENDELILIHQTNNTQTYSKQFWIMVWKRKTGQELVPNQSLVIPSVII